MLEWLAHHRAAGFDHFVVFSNDCDDGTDTMLDHLADQGGLTHVRNDGPHDKGGIQFTALKAAAKMDVVQQADWLLPLDVDEFVNIHVGDHTLTALHNALPDATAITLTWRLFGNDGIVQYTDRPVTEQFTGAAARIMNWPWRASMFKTLYRNDGIYRKLGVHRPRSPDKDRLDQARWFDGCGRELGDRFKRQQIFSPFGRDNYALAQLNHYPLGAMESYLIKRDRGRAVHDGDELGMSYWVERNWDVEKDTTISALKPARDAQLNGLLDDSELSQMHADAVAWRHAKFESLMAEEPYRALFGRLMMTPASRPLDLKSARYLYQFAQRAPDRRD